MAPWYRIPHTEAVIWRERERADLEPAEAPAAAPEADEVAPKRRTRKSGEAADDEQP